MEVLYSTGGMKEMYSSVIWSLFFCVFIVCWLWRRRNAEDADEGSTDTDQRTTENSWRRHFGHDAIEAARIIRSHQGNHEAEVSCGGEADLHRHYKRCQKNPGHGKFIPVEDFKKEHLPAGHRDDDVVDYIRAEADLTCRVSVRYTSENRPKFHPGRQSLSYYPFYQDRGLDFMRTGTGWVTRVYKYTEENNKYCQCEVCTRPGTHTPKKIWGKVIIATACHVVFDSDEARHTTCEFFYDTSSTHVSQCPTLTGLKVEGSNIVADWCKMTFVSHDMDMIDMLYEIMNHYKDTGKKVNDKYGSHMNKAFTAYGVSCLTDPTPEPMVIISHPHGCSKMVTVGMWTHRQTWSEIHKQKTDDGREADRVFTSYSYNTPTCPGSSGAPVFRLPMKGEWWAVCYLSHSEGRQGNNNKSGILGEMVSPPIRI